MPLSSCRSNFSYPGQIGSPWHPKFSRRNLAVFMKKRQPVRSSKSVIMWNTNIRFDSVLDNCIHSLHTIACWYIRRNVQSIHCEVSKVVQKPNFVKNAILCSITYILYVRDHHFLLFTKKVSVGRLDSNMYSSDLLRFL